MEVAAPATYDCQTCGACCYGPEDYVDVKPADLVRMSKRTWTRHTARLGPRFVMKMTHGHCSALHARQGHYSCRIYAQRPDACRIVEPGSAECLNARAKRNLG